MLRDLQLGLVRLYLLEWAIQGPVYGVQLMERLSEHGHPISFGTLYPMLHQLEGEDLLMRRDTLVAGRRRKYYQATGKAQDYLQQATQWLAQAQAELEHPTALRLAEYAGPSAGGEDAPFISVRELHAWQSIPADLRPAIVDVRTRDEYVRGHIPSSGNAPLDDLPEGLSQFVAGSPVVTYCTMHHRGSSRSERAARLLRHRGYRTWVLDGGLPAWSAASLPVEATG